TGHDIEGGLASLLERRRTDQNLLEVVGADQIAKSGDSNAAEALQRLSGLTVVGGRYVYVRGMGERYSSALLHGSSLPSPDPARRVVPLDLFPAGAIESLAVQKTYSPDMPGEFGGGVTQIKTRGIPERFNANLSLSSAYNDASTFRSGLRGHNGAYDWTGFDDGTRNLPPAVITASAHRPLHLSDSISNDGYSLPVLTALGQTMPNNWSARRRSSLGPDVGLNGSLGDRFELGPGAIGYSAGVSYEHKFRNRSGVNRVFGLGAGNSLEPITDYKTNLTRRTVDMSGLATVGYQPVKGQEVAVTTLVTRSTEDEAEIYGGYLANEDRQIRLTSLSWVEEQLLATQLRGRHTLLLGVIFDWSYTFANATRDQPDWRRSRYDLDPSLQRWLLSNRPEGNQRLYNKVNDDNHDVSGALDFPIPVWANLTAHLKTGGGYIIRDREAETRRFKFIHRGPVSRDTELLQQTPERVFAKQNISPDGFSFEEITRATDNYEADQTIAAGFVNGIVPMHERLELSLGVRVERSRQRVATFDLFSHQPTSQKADLDTTDYLPATGLVWRFHDDMQLRFAYGHTVSRPDFRELSAAPYDQVVGAGVFMGNPKLERATIDNFDLRWEWYLSRDEQFSFGLFYKDLRHPIETVIRGGANRTITLENAPRGRNYGLEVESRKRFGFIADALDPLFLGWNLAVIKSEVKLDAAGVGTNKKRPLAGQSGFVVNASFGWDDLDTRTTAVILYNVAAQRLVGVGTFGLPDIYEQPFHKLDLVLSWGFLENLTIKFQADNLLAWRQTFLQDGKVTERYEVGRTFSLSLSGQF
ncbi:MAG: TonB-dependent receptor, partial [Planctomycetota bacterium]